MFLFRRSLSGHQGIQHPAQVRSRQLDIGELVLAGA
jgi:hypothetical protein